MSTTTTATMTEDSDRLALHRLVFANDVLGVAKHLIGHADALRAENMVKDMHGNTPLHIAVMFGYRECVTALVQHGHSIYNKNHQGWTPLQEAVSYGDRGVIVNMLKYSRESELNKKTNKVRADAGAFLFVCDFITRLSLAFMGEATILF